jgi:flagellar hook-length control protein FliK
MGTRDALVQLHPIELGRISIRISTEGGRVRADVRAEKVETLDALQRHLPELRASFAQQGLDAQEFQLSLGFQNGAREEWRGDSPRAPQSKKTAENSLNPLNNTTLVRAIASESSIDTFA